MTFIEAISRWRALPENQQRLLRWEAIPQQVADSMAFEGEAVDIEWLKSLHPKMDPQGGLKPATESSAIHS